MMSEQFEERFARLDELLFRHRQWWQLPLFHHRQSPWRQSHPDFIETLLALPEQQLLVLRSDAAKLDDFLSSWLNPDDLIALRQLCRLPRLGSLVDLNPTEKRMLQGVPGRKLQQLQYFASAWQSESVSEPESAPEPVLEWCAGKGHLGRLLSAQCGCSVTSLEWQEGLCESGEVLAHKNSIEQVFVCDDAMGSTAASLLQTHPQAIALHACGDLHLQLMQNWCNENTVNTRQANQQRRLALVPCCYHLIATPTYQPLSRRAQQAGVRLSKADLSLPLRETVTSGSGDKRRREQELLWRMAFDEWQREARGVDEYLTIPAARKSQLSSSFTRYVQTMAQHKNLLVPANVDESHWLEAGQHRKAQVQRLELVQQVFRRPLEMWLLLDRALFLQERGAEVSMAEFCPAELTPRNVMISANLH